VQTMLESCQLWWPPALTCAARTSVDSGLRVLALELGGPPPAAFPSSAPQEDPCRAKETPTPQPRVHAGSGDSKV
jgi:hypothetical protein